MPQWVLVEHGDLVGLITCQRLLHRLGVHCFIAQRGARIAEGLRNIRLLIK